MYRLKEPNPDFHDHDNIDYLITIGPQPQLAEAALNAVNDIERMPALLRFSAMWDGLQEQLQTPVCDDDEEFRAYTGHRLVFMDQSGKQYALGFQLYEQKKSDDRVISASWRRVYSEDYLVRARVEKDEHWIYLSRVRREVKTKTLLKDIGRLEELYEKFIAALPHEEPNYKVSA